jgi:hypothetical protein
MRAPQEPDRSAAAPTEAEQLALDYRGFWIGSRDTNPMFVPVTPPAELLERILKALRGW